MEYVAAQRYKATSEASNALRCYSFISLNTRSLGQWFSKFVLRPTAAEQGSLLDLHFLNLTQNLQNQKLQRVGCYTFQVEARVPTSPQMWIGLSKDFWGM